MRSILLSGLTLLLALCTRSDAQNPADLPSCALICTTSIAAESCSSALDVQCICTNAQVKSDIESCVRANCTIKEALTAQNFSAETCGTPKYDNRLVGSLVALIGGVLSLIAVVLRLSGRYLASKIGPDDWTIVLAMLINIPMSALAIPLYRNGLGLDLWTLSYKQITSMIYYFWIEEVLYIINIAVIKISVVLLYLRIFPTPAFALATKIILAFLVCWGVTFTIAQIFICTPVNGMWKSWDGEWEGHCNSTSALAWTHAIINIVLDLVILGLPLPMLIRLHVSFSRKLGLALMFSVGIIVTVISILRLRTLVIYGHTENPSRDFVGVGVWSLVEVSLGIICVSMPAIQTLCKHVAPNIFGALSTQKRSTAQRSRQKSSPYSSNPEPDRDGGPFIILQESSFKVEDHFR